MNPAQQREALIIEGLRLAQARIPTRQDIERLCKSTGIAPRRFRRLFGSWGDFVEAMARQQHAEICAEVFQAINTQPSGTRRLVRGCHAYLDACLRYRNAGALVARARRTASAAKAARQRGAELAQSLAGEFNALGWPYAMPAASLLVAILANSAREERKASTMLPALRATVEQFVGTYGRGPVVTGGSVQIPL